MAQSLEVNIKTTSDVPQAMDKAKSATVGFGKQVEDIQKKFSTGFKDIFLGFFAPMVIFNEVLSVIRQNMEEARQLAKEGVDLISKGESINAKENEVTLANIAKTKETMDKKAAETEAGQKYLLNWFVYNTEEGKQFAKAVAENMISPEGAKNAIDQFGGYEGLLKRYLESPEGKKAQEEVKQATPVQDNKPTNFKGPEGFGNVVGVGANPVMEAMTLQLEEAKKQTQLLEDIRNGNGGGVPTDFTKPQPINAASRSGSI